MCSAITWTSVGLRRRPAFGAMRGGPARNAPTEEEAERIVVGRPEGEGAGPFTTTLDHKLALERERKPNGTSTEFEPKPPMSRTSPRWRTTLGFVAAEVGPGAGEAGVARRGDGHGVLPVGRDALDQMGEPALDEDGRAARAAAEETEAGVHQDVARHRRDRDDVAGVSVRTGSSRRRLRRGRSRRSARALEGKPDGRRGVERVVPGR